MVRPWDPFDETEIPRVKRVDILPSEQELAEGSPSESTPSLVLYSTMTPTFPVKVRVRQEGVSKGPELGRGSEGPGVLVCGH